MKRKKDAAIQLNINPEVVRFFKKKAKQERGDYKKFLADALLLQMSAQAALDAGIVNRVGFVRK